MYVDLVWGMVWHSIVKKKTEIKKIIQIKWNEKVIWKNWYKREKKRINTQECHWIFGDIKSGHWPPLKQVYHYNNVVVVIIIICGGGGELVLFGLFFSIYGFHEYMWNMLLIWENRQYTCDGDVGERGCWLASSVNALTLLTLKPMAFDISFSRKPRKCSFSEFAIIFARFRV